MTAVVPLPERTLDGTGVRLYRQSGRPLPLWLDLDKTEGPNTLFVVGSASKVYADDGVWRMRLTPPDGGPTVEVSVTVGTGVGVDLPPNGVVLDSDLDVILAALRSELATRYAGTGEAETIGGQWQFTTLPLDAQGNPFGGGGDVTAQMLAQALGGLAERYLSLADGGTVDGQTMFATAPLGPDGQPIVSANGLRELLDALDQRVDSLDVSAFPPVGGVTRAQLSPDVRALLTTSEAVTDAIADLKERVAALEGNVHGDDVSRVSWAQLAFTTPTDPGNDDYTSIPGYPGTHRTYAGTCPGGTGADIPGYPAPWFDSRLFSSDGTSAAPKKVKLMRRYYNGPKLSAEERSAAQGFMSEGRIVVGSFKLSKYGAGNWSLAEVVSGAADADIDAGLTFWKNATGPGHPGGGYPVWLTPLYHEPENFESATEKVNYRKACRHVVQRAEALGITNIAWVAPMFIMVSDVRQKDYKDWHPEWNDAGTDWVKNADGSRKKIIDILGIDYYTPFCVKADNQFKSTTRNLPWAFQIVSGGIDNKGVQFAGMLGTLIADGHRKMPMMIGEYGSYSFPDGVTTKTGESVGSSSMLDNDGITASMIMNEQIETQVYDDDFPLIGVCDWQHGTCRMDDANDVKNKSTDKFGERATARRNLVAGKVLRDTAGHPITRTGTGGTPRADYRWVDNPLGNPYVHVTV